MWLEKLFIVYLLTLFNSMDGYNLDNHNHRSGRHRRKGWWLNTQHTTQCQRQTIESTQFVTAEEEEESWTILSTFCVRTLSKSWLSRRTCHRRAARDSIVVRRLSVSLFSFCADTMLSVSTAIIMNPLPDWNNFRQTFAAVPHLSSLSPFPVDLSVTVQWRIELRHTQKKKLRKNVVKWKIIPSSCSLVQF